MNDYIESNVNLLIRLTREAHEPFTELRRYKLYAKTISDVLYTIEKYHGLYYMHYIAYTTSLRLGHALGPMHKNIAYKLMTKHISISSRSYIMSY